MARPGRKTFESLLREQRGSLARVEARLLDDQGLHPDDRAAFEAHAAKLRKRVAQTEASLAACA